MIPFSPAWWLPNGHTQTIWASKVQRYPQLKYNIERFELADGDETAIAWYPSNCSLDGLNTDENKTTANVPTVVLLHGLEGSADSNYARGTAYQLAKLGWQVAILHFRGCHGGPNKVQRTYHSGDTDDLRWFLNALKHRAPTTPIYAVGYSLGGNVLLKYLGEESEASLIDTAVAVSVPYKLNEAADRLDTGASRLYQHVLLSSLKQKFLSKFANRECPIDLGLVPPLKTIRAYDEIVTAPLHGFQSAEDYYQRSSCHQFLGAISTPTLLLHATDDPLVPHTAIPDESTLSRDTQLECYPQGGHVAFVSGTKPWHPHYWLDERIASFLQNRY